VLISFVSPEPAGQWLNLHGHQTTVLMIVTSLHECSAQRAQVHLTHHRLLDITNTYIL
jgi:hypothetical protein